ncbi:MAG: hypothetical protein U0414_25570 [Polyangiaceae bacterium]
MRLSRLASFAALVPLALAIASCDAATPDDDGKVDDPQLDSVVDTADALVVTTPEFVIPPGDSFTCFYTKFTTTEELAIVSGDGVQGQGGHHIIAYFADEPRPVGNHPCTDEEMVNLNQIAGSAGDGGQVLALPPGLAIHVPVGKQIVVQAHYINTTGVEEKVHDTVKIVKGKPADVKSFVNYFVTNDDAFEIAPNAPLVRETECTIDKDYQMAIALPHMHELGNHFTLDVIGTDGKPRERLIDTDWALSYSSHPPVKTWSMDAPYVLKKGEKLRQKCEWQNSTMDPVIFPREMCLSFFYYWPGGGDLDCKMVPVAQ